MTNSAKYHRQRTTKTPPHLTIKSLRDALGLTIDQVIARVQEEVEGITLTRGHVSAIENGHRGASQQLLDAMCSAYGLPAGALVTDFMPRSRELKTGEDAA